MISKIACCCFRSFPLFPHYGHAAHMSIDISAWPADAQHAAATAARALPAFSHELSKGTAYYLPSPWPYKFTLFLLSTAYH